MSQERQESKPQDLVPAAARAVIAMPAMVEFDPMALVDNIKEADELVAQSGRVAIAGEADFARAGDLVRLVKAHVARLEDERKRRVKPHDDYVKEINAWFKAVRAPLEQADQSVRAKMKAWGDEEERQRREAAEAERRRREEEALALAESTAKAGRPDVADEILDRAVAVPAPEAKVSKVRGGYGSTSGMAKVWQVDIVSLAALPAEYLRAIMADEDALDAIRRAIKGLTAPLLKSADPEHPPVVPGLDIHQVSRVNVR